MTFVRYQLVADICPERFGNQRGLISSKMAVRCNAADWAPLRPVISVL